MDKFAIPPEKVEDVRMWFRDRGGVVKWTNKEIGVQRPEQLTPATHEDGTPATAPHWAYAGAPEPLTPEDIVVRTETKIEPPAEWFPVCEHCQGSGRRTVQSLAEARGESVNAVRGAIAFGDICVYHCDGETFDCSWCQGIGHTERKVRVAIRKHYWGYGISETGKQRAQRYANRLGKDVKWDWEHEGYGRASIVFYRETIEPFTL